MKSFKIAIKSSSVLLCKKSSKIHCITSDSLSSSSLGKIVQSVSSPNLMLISSFFVWACLESSFAILINFFVGSLLASLPVL